MKKSLCIATAFEIIKEGRKGLSYLKPEDFKKIHDAMCECAMVLAPYVGEEILNEPKFPEECPFDKEGEE